MTTHNCIHMKTEPTWPGCDVGTNQILWAFRRYWTTLSKNPVQEKRTPPLREHQQESFVSVLKRPNQLVQAVATVKMEV
ncbi:hypothetical protein SK128_015200 [Halocaridina rubra]|uniref:Uncharacterized protein n=1 Tax=Halocaridina rubra TaxID=373956 RepID=A0AAN9ACQ8_HALRR